LEKELTIINLEL